LKYAAKLKNLTLMKYTTTCLLILLSVFALQTTAQQLPMIGMFYKTQLFYNPAFAGSTESVRATLLHRAQWRNVPGAPSTQLFVVDAPVGRNVGAGLVVSRDQIGNFTRYDILANASYRVYVNPESYFQAGIRAGVSLINIGENLFQWDDNDPLYYGPSRKGTVPRIGAGLIYKTPIFYVGVSAPDMLSVDSKKFFSSEAGNSSIKRNYTAMGGARFNLSEYITLVPSALVVYYPSRPVMASANLGFEFNQTVTIGAGYVTPKIVALSGMVAFTTKLKVGYRYEIGTSSSEIGKFSTNEFMLSYGLN